MANRKKVEVEFVFKCSAKFLYRYIANPSGLSEWFADDVSVNKQIYTFYWDGSPSEATLSQRKQDKHVKFDWVENPDEYIALTLKDYAMTGELGLIITDFCDEGEEEETRSLWESAIGELRGIIGA